MKDDVFNRVLPQFFPKHWLLAPVSCSPTFRRVSESATSFEATAATLTFWMTSSPGLGFPLKSFMLRLSPISQGFRQPAFRLRKCRVEQRDGFMRPMITLQQCASCSRMFSESLPRRSESHSYFLVAPRRLLLLESGEVSGAPAVARSGGT